MTRPLNVAIVFGTRPDAVKMAPVVHSMAANPAINCITIVTAQHREMLDEVLGLFEIKPAYDLKVMTEGQSLTDVTTRVLERMSSVLEDCKPDVVLVHGDTTTSTASALANGVMVTAPQPCARKNAERASVNRAASRSSGWCTPYSASSHSR